MQGRINIIAFDINVNDPNYNKFSTLSATEKFAILASLINQIAEQFEKSDPDAMLIVAWHEYGITDANSRFISRSDKNNIKKGLQDLTTRFPNLVILAGTMAIKRHFDKFTLQLHRDIRAEYLDIEDIYLSEIVQAAELKKKKELAVTAHEQVKHHFETNAIIFNLQLEQAATTGIDVIRNSLFCYQHGQCQRIDKLAPYFELKDNDGNDLANAIFRPGKKDTKSRILQLEHPLTKETVRIGVEICREHTFGLLAKRIKEDQLLAPHIHIVIADGMNPFLANICSPYYLLIDSKNKPGLITANTAEASPLIELYQVNALAHGLMQGPLEPFYPPEKAALDLLNAHINEMPDELKDKRTELMKIRDRFIDNDLLYHTTHVFKTLVSDMKKYARSNIATMAARVNFFEAKSARDTKVDTLFTAILDLSKDVIAKRIKDKSYIFTEALPLASKDKKTLSIPSLQYSDSR